MSTITGPITAEDILAMPDDGVDRELIRGEVREKPRTYRDHLHCRLTARFTYLLHSWLEKQPLAKGHFLCGSVAVRLCRDPETTVAMDLAYVSTEALDKNWPERFFVEAAPILAIEVLSPSDMVGDVTEKVDLYLEYGVAVVWIVHPQFQTVTIHRPNISANCFDLLDDLVCEPELPGFRVPMKEVFEFIVGGESDSRLGQWPETGTRKLLPEENT